jgi:DNA mismatch endonuclease (patch repair protein)
MARIREESRSRVMSAIKRRDTKSEIAFRKELWRRGLRGYRIDAKLFGRPDIYFTKFKLCIFIDGCFWHGCPLHFRGVSTNAAYWLPKIERNRVRDVQVTEALLAAGYRVKRFWDHQIIVGHVPRAVAEIEAMLGDLRSNG